MIKLEFTLEEAQTLVNVLQQGQYGIVSPLINKVVSAANAYHASLKEEALKETSDES